MVVSANYYQGDINAHVETRFLLVVCQGLSANHALWYVSKYMVDSIAIVLLLQARRLRYHMAVALAIELLQTRDGLPRQRCHHLEARHLQKER